MKNYYKTKLALFSLGVFLLLFAVSKPAIAQNYQIDHIRGNVYRFTAGNYRSVFMETDEGIVVSDPISKQAATWLKQELAKRFDKPIRFVIYSHNHPDHVYGGEVFDEQGVQFVSHRLAREDLVNTKAKTQIPNLVFEDEMVLYIGKSLVRLRYHGRNNGRGSISMLFEPAGVLHVVDWIVLGRMPYKDLQGYDIQGMIDSTKQVLDMDFDVFVGGHASTGQKKDIKRYLNYLETLYNSVRDGILVGKDLATLQQEIRLDDYRDLPMYSEWLPLNIKGVYRTLVDESYLLMRPDVPRRSNKKN
ncbi:MBL fold metallo-hydrolase [Nostoc linckia]|uniref:MBL fold metallo-hydrolase n=1 Tax=Nostoc linckia TaxID=92942 RepID=UPI000BFFAF23|nr:MBL fold metallo-hydrolase [Nostoc linckia]